MSGEDGDEERRTPKASQEKRISAELDAMIRLHTLSALSLIENDSSNILGEIVDVAIELGTTCQDAS